MKDKRCGLAVYEHAAGVLARVDEGAGMRTALYEHEMPNAVRPSVLALVSETLKSKERLETALEATDILTGVSTPHDRCMTLVLTFELAVRGGTIKGGAKSALVRAVFGQKAALIALLGGLGPVAPAAPRQKLPRYVRVNTLRTTVEAALEYLEKENGLQRGSPAAPGEAAAAPLWRKGAVLADPLLPSLLVLPPGTNLHGHALVTACTLALAVPFAAPSTRPAAALLSLPVTLYR